VDEDLPLHQETSPQHVPHRPALRTAGCFFWSESEVRRPRHCGTAGNTSCALRCSATVAREIALGTFANTVARQAPQPVRSRKACRLEAAGYAAGE